MLISVVIDVSVFVRHNNKELTYLLRYFTPVVTVPKSFQLHHQAMRRYE